MGVTPGAESAEPGQRRTPAELFSKARFRECLLALEGDASPSAVIMRMRAMIYLGEHNAVIRADMLDTVGRLPLAERAIANALLARGYYRERMHAAAANAISRALDIARQSDNQTAIAAANYYAALIRLSDGVLDEAEHYANLAASDPEWGPAAMDVLAWVYGNRGDQRRQLEQLLVAHRSTVIENVWGKAAILHAASSLARDLFDQRAADQIESLAERLDWSEETRVQECYTFRYLAWCAALAGNSLHAFEHFARAESCAPNLAHLVLINVDRAFIAHYRGERKTAERYLEISRYQADHADWNQSEEAQTALLLLAQMMSLSDPQEAARLVHVYTDLTQRVSPLLRLGNGDQRREAIEQFTAGLVYRSLGERALAVSALKNALQIWRQLEYHWRVALAARNLAEITGRSHYGEMADVLVRQYAPRAFFVTDLLSASGVTQRRRDHPDVAALSPGRRDVLYAFLDGKNNAQISELLGLSQQTIKNRMGDLFRHFGVHSSRELHSELRRRGIE